MLNGSGMEDSQAEVASVSELRIVRSLLWDNLKSRIPPAEHDVVRSAIGEALLSENEALFAEADALADVVAMLKLHAQHSQERRQVVLLNPARFLVENELASLLKKLGSRERDAPATAAQARAARVLSASTSGRAQRCDAPRTSSASGRARQASQEDPMELRGETPQSSRVASPPPGVGHTEAWGGGGGGSGGGPGHRRPPTSRPHSTRPSTSSTSALGLAEMVRQLEGQVSAAGIDDVAETLRDMFAGEREALRDDIEWLQGCADQALDEVVASEEAPPPLREMRAAAKDLRDLADGCARHALAELRVRESGTERGHERKKLPALGRRTANDVDAGCGGNACDAGQGMAGECVGASRDVGSRVKGRLTRAVSAARQLCD